MMRSVKILLFVGKTKNNIHKDKKVRSLFKGCLNLVSGSPFQADGTEHSFAGEMYVNSGTMDRDTSEVAMGLRFFVRMQVVSINNCKMELYEYDTRLLVMMCTSRFQI